ncbi:serine hydrolase [Microbacterium sp. CFH 90308]|uniref:Serine hydrolase n=1 Tax=Microbacterium salsuginis TaxID=2722803 RepID=A0ABX1K823_9MICO|nr:serine hydrolase [Microbacterium sp. CFH 90308]NLP82503.1 serine hydrolase [Microbacterium sp. CFH 90308]
MLILTAAPGLLTGCHTVADAGPSARDSAHEQLVESAAAADSTCVSVAEGDTTIVSDGDPDGDPVRAFSITKSVTSLLIGIAQDEGHLEISDPVADFVSDWQNTSSAAVTIRDLLTNTSGREWDSRTDYREMALQADDKTAFALGLGQDADPGEEWIYNNSAVQVLEAVLEAATGMAVDEFAQTRLFEPLGLTGTRLEHDGTGNANVFAGLWTTCADLSSLGRLLLDDGMVDGRRVISEEFLDEAVGGPSTDLNAAYGLLWWLNRPGPAVAPEVATSARGGAIEGPLVPAAPEDTFWALGFHDQILMVVPSLDAVAVRLGEKPPSGSGFGLRAFSEGVLQVVREG